MNLPSISSSIGQHWLDQVRRRVLSDPSSALVFAHQGVMDHAVVERLVAEAESASLNSADGLVQRKRLVNVLVEGLENLHHHTLSSHRDLAFALLVRETRGYVLAMGNAVPLATAALLTHRIAILNEMDEVDLKEHFLRLLSNGSRSEHGGAGLGLMTIARKSVKPIVTSTQSLCPVSAFFAMELRVAA